MKERSVIGASPESLSREELEAEVHRLRAALPLAHPEASEDFPRGAATAPAPPTAHAPSADRRADRQRAVFRSAIDFAMVVIDPTGIITDWNPGAEHVMGWSAAEMCGQDAARFFTPEDRAAGCIEHEMHEALEAGRAMDERWHLRKGGQRFWASGEMMPLHEDGVHLGFVKILRDHTDQRRALIRQQAETAFMRSVLASSADCIKVLDLDARLTFMSEGGMKIMEISDFNAVKGCPWPDFWTGQGNHDALAALDTARAGGVGHFQGMASTYLGTPKWWDVQVTPILGADGEPDKLLGVSRDISGQKAIEDRLAASEARWRGLFDGMQEGFFLGELVRDASGRAVDYRFVEINPAFARQSGLPADSVGKTIRTFVPEIDQRMIDNYARVVETGEPTLFEIDVPGLSRTFEVRANRDRDDRFSCLFLDVTARKQAEIAVQAGEARRNALLQLGDGLRDLTDVGAMTRAAAGIVGRTLGATRAGFGRIVGDVEEIDIEPDWTAPGQVSIAGRHRFSDYGDIRANLARGEPLVIDDVTTDPRTADDPGPMLTIGVGALINMPVRERGRAVAVFIVHDVRPRAWTAEEIAFLRNVADRLEAGVARLRAEELQAVLNKELAHRLKNTLAIVQSIATQTLRGVTEREPVEAFERRVLALSRAHDVLMQKSWSAAKMRAVMEGVLGMQADLDRFALDGPDMDISPQAALSLSLSLLLHELATNALKYGALSARTGTVRVSWRTDGETTPALVLDWTETGGPVVTPPRNKGGFGSRLIRMGLLGTRDAALDFQPAGLKAEFRAPLTDIQVQVH